MGTSINARRRRFTEEVGELGKPKVWINKDGIPRHIIRCRECRWTSPSDGESSGQGSTRPVALMHWGKHLAEKHGVHQVNWDAARVAEKVAEQEARARAGMESLRAAGFTAEQIERASRLGPA